MNNLKSKIKFFCRIGFKTLYFNFKYLPFKQAVHLPFFISRKVYFREISGSILLDCPVSPGIVRIGFGDVGIFDDKKSRTIWDVTGTVLFKGKADIGHGSKIAVGCDGKLVFGRNFQISAESSIIAFSEIQFGDNCLLSWDVLIMDTDLHNIRDLNGNIINEAKPVLIGDKVWIGCRSLILKGVSIPCNCIIGANSMVNKSLEKESCVYAGQPVKYIKEIISWEM